MDTQREIYWQELDVELEKKTKLEIFSDSIFGNLEHIFANNSIKYFTQVDNNKIILVPRIKEIHRNRSKIFIIYINR